MQSMYRKIQEKGLQVAYNNGENRTVKGFTHKMAALAFVPISDVEASLLHLKRKHLLKRKNALRTSLQLM